MKQFNKIDALASSVEISWFWANTKSKSKTAKIRCWREVVNQLEAVADYDNHINGWDKEFQDSADLLMDIAVKYIYDLKNGVK